MKALRLFSSIQSKLIIIYVLLILIAMQLIGVYFVRTLESYFINNFSDSLRKQTYLLAEFVEPYLNVKVRTEDASSEPTKDINAMVEKLFTLSGAEIQIIDGNGIVLSTSIESHRDVIGKKNTQTEVSRALQGIRLNERMVVDIDGLRKKRIATPIGSGGNIVGAIYIVASMEDLYRNMSRINQIFISGTVIALVLTALLGVILSSTITAPIKQIRKSTRAIAEGQFNQFVTVRSADEIGQLAESFNFMTSRLKEALGSIEEEKEKLAQVLANMSDGVVAADVDGRVIVMNRQAHMMFGILESEMVPRNMARLLNMNWSTIKEQAEHPDEAKQMWLQMQDEVEETRTVRITFTAIRRTDRKMAGIIAVLHDVTQQEQLEQQRKDFVANVSHELRTPLTTIKSYLEALVEDGALQEPELAERFLAVTRNETERMIRLVNDLLLLSQLDRPQSLLQPSSVNVTELLDEVSDRFAFQMQQKQMTCEVQVPTDLPPLLAERDKLDQVLDNLVSNAIKFTPEQGRIVIKAVRNDERWLTLSVSDNGIGIPKQDIAYIFDRFYRVDKGRSRQMGGTGLGLSIARTIVHAHGGTITIDSQLHKGTTVTFTLPVDDKGSATHV
jgi:two-component system sensor histidine kinase VicK